MLDINCYRDETTFKKNVLQIIRKLQPITRSDIAVKTGLSMTSVTKFTSALIADGIVSEQGTLESTGGRKSSLLGINPEYAYVIGIDLGGFSSKFGVVRMDGSIVEEWFIPTVDENIMPITGMDITSLSEKIKSILAQYGPERILAICIGISGMVDHQLGKVIFCPNIAGWNNMMLADILQEEFNLPVFVDTSARCMALAEQYYGAGQDVPNQVFVSLGSYDIAAAIIIESQMFRGSHGFAGEIGHVMSSDTGANCTCGNTDCLELSATLKMIKSEICGKVANFSGYSPLRQMMPEHFTADDLMPDMIAQAMEAGDKQCYEAINQAGVRVGTALANMLNILNPDLVILGGGVIENFPGMMDTIRETVRKRALVTIQQNLEIQKAALGWRGSITGSASLAIARFFN
ncbi:MAG: ROK family protein [Clostridiaceae bacterium]|nr:ROK family protein [Clostridiaceae bacterium]